MSAAALIFFGLWFAIAFVLRSIVHKRTTGDTGIRVGALGPDASPTERLAYVLLLVALVGAVAAPIAAMRGLAPLIASTTVNSVGVVLVTAGTVLTYIAQRAMGTQWRMGVDKAEVTLLVTTDVFALVRNPFFSAMLVTSTGLAAMVPNLVAVGAVLALLVALELQVRIVEEPFLQNLHGADYTTYAATVGRFAPGIGRLKRSAT